MSVKCPSCGFDSPDGAQWCDFCKEPFKKKERPPATGATSPAAAPPSTPAAPKTQTPSSSPKNIEELPQEVRAKIQTLLAAPDDREKVPAIPNWFRALAWLFMAVWLVSGIIVGGILLGRQRSRQESAPLGPSAARPQ